LGETEGCQIDVRYGRRGDKQRIAEWMQTHNSDVFDEFDETNLAPSFNVAPQSSSR
jgi:hypothetical protein